MDADALLDAATLTASLVALAVSLYTHRRDQTDQSHPVLVFSSRANRWCLESVGPGPAVYVVVGEGDSEGRWHAVTNCYPIAVGTRLDLTWLLHTYQLAAGYGDVD